MQILSTIWTFSIVWTELFGTFCTEVVAVNLWRRIELKKNFFGGGIRRRRSGGPATPPPLDWLLWWSGADGGGDHERHRDLATAGNPSDYQAILAVLTMVMYFVLPKTPARWTEGEHRHLQDELKMPAKGTWRITKCWTEYTQVKEHERTQ